MPGTGTPGSPTSSRSTTRWPVPAPPGHKAPGGGPIPRAVQQAITHALTDVGPLTFVASRDAVIDDHPCAHVRSDGILVTLGPVDGSGDRV